MASSISPWMIFLLFSIPISAQPPSIHESELLCGTSPPPPNTTFIPMFIQVMELLSQQVTSQINAHTSLTSPKISIFTLFHCFNDLSQSDCLQCYAASRTRLPHCLPSTSGRIYLDGCFLRYDNYSFFHETIDPLHDNVNCDDTTGSSSYDLVNFRKSVGEVIGNVTAKAVVDDNGYGVWGGNGVFGLAQCWSSVGKEGCGKCLGKARREIGQCLPGKEGRALFAGCFLRYSTSKFFSNREQGSGSSSGELLSFSIVFLR